MSAHLRIGSSLGGRGYVVYRMVGKQPVDLQWRATLLGARFNRWRRERWARR